MQIEHPGYRARNLDVAKIYGLNSGLCNIQNRLKKRKDCPVWLLKELEDMIQRSNCLIKPLVQFRDEIAPTLEFKYSCAELNTNCRCDKLIEKSYDGICSQSICPRLAKEDKDAEDKD